jgi:hypothetical protein
MTLMRRSAAAFGHLAAILLAAQLGCSSAGSSDGTGRGGNGGGGTVGSGGGAGNPGAGGASGTSAGGGGAGGLGGGGGASAGSAGTSGGGGAGAGASGSGGSTGAGGRGGAGGAGGAGAGGTGTGGTSSGGTGAARGGSGGAGGTAGTSAGGSSGAGGRGGAAGGGGTGGTAPTVTCPSLPGAVKSGLYGLSAGGTTAFVEQMTKFSPEMQVHYAHCLVSGGGTATFAVTVNESFTSFTLSPKSRNIAATRSGNTITFTSGPNYLILQVDAKELLFILIDGDESSPPPRLGDTNVKNLADYTVDNTGAALVTAKVQSAIDAASGAAQNVLYVPPGKYKVGELWLRSNMTLYLAAGAVLYGSGATGDFNTGSGGINIEGCEHGMIRMYQIKNTKVLGRGVIDGNGKAIRAQNDTKVNLFKIEQSQNIVIDGILVRDPSFWNTLVYRSDMVTIQNYKVVNCRPTTTTYNNTDGVNFDESTNGKLTNAFLYTGDDNMATKNEEASGTVNTSNIVHDKIVCYSNSVCAKVGTKTMGQTIDGVVFRNIDVVKAGRALNIDAYDTAVVQNTRYENVRIEAADSSMIDLSSDMPPTWRTAANTSIIKDTYFTNVASDVKQPIVLHGKSSTVNIVGVHFMNLTVQGRAVTTQTDADASWNINAYVSGIAFQ